MARSVRTVVEPPVARITLDRPPLNVLDIPMIGELESAVREAQQRDDLALVVFESAVPNAFSSGVDVKDHVPERAAEMLRRFHSVFLRLHEVDAITLAAVDGHCLGGGCELAMACDLVFATEQCRFQLPELDLGCFPPVAAVLLARRLGSTNALMVMLAGAPLKADDAKNAFMVNLVAPDRSHLALTVDAVADGLSKKSVPVVRALKRAFRKGLELPYPDSLRAAEEIYLKDILPLDDMREGVAAFLEKRPPRWKHR